MLISTALLLDSIIRNSVCTPAKLPCRRVEVGYEKLLRQQGFYRRFKNRDRSLNQSDLRERGFNRSRFLNYKTRVVFKIFSNTNILSEILINSEIIRGASQYTKCGGCRGYYGNNINKFGKKQFSSLKCAKTFQKK
jgi:hypothetical protein